MKIERERSEGCLIWPLSFPCYVFGFTLSQLEVLSAGWNISPSFSSWKFIFSSKYSTRTFLLPPWLIEKRKKVSCPSSHFAFSFIPKLWLGVKLYLGERTREREQREREKRENGVEEREAWKCFLLKLQVIKPVNVEKKRMFQSTYFLPSQIFLSFSSSLSLLSSFFFSL